MVSVIGIIAFLLLAPLVAGFMEGLGGIISAILCGEEPPHILFAFKILRRIYIGSRSDKNIKSRTFILLNLIFIMSGGSVFFAGGNIALSVVLLLFAEVIRIYNTHITDVSSTISGLENNIVGGTVFFSQLFLTVAGLYCVTDRIYHNGSYKLADILSVDLSPAFYMPAILVGYICMLLYSFNTEALLQEKILEIKGKEAIFLIIGRWYRTIIFYAILFLLNYGTTIISAVMSIGISLLVWLLGQLLKRPHSDPPGPLALSMMHAIVMVASFVNLLILLAQ